MSWPTVYVAFRLGDPTAKNAGRPDPSIPLKHLDPLGVLAFIIMKIGLGPNQSRLTPRYFRNPQAGYAQGSPWLAPSSNLLLAVASAALAHTVVNFFYLPPLHLSPTAGFHAGRQACGSTSCSRCSNCIPIPPLGRIQGTHGPTVAAKTPAAFAKTRTLRFFLFSLPFFYTGIISQVIMPIIQFSQLPTSGIKKKPGKMPGLFLLSAGVSSNNLIFSIKMAS